MMKRWSVLKASGFMVVDDEVGLRKVASGIINFYNGVPLVAENALAGVALFKKEREE